MLIPPLMAYLDDSGRTLLASGWTPFVLIANGTRGMFPWRQIVEGRDEREAERILMAFRTHGQE